VQSILARASLVITSLKLMTCIESSCARSTHRVMSRAEGRRPGSSCMHAAMIAATSGGHSSSVGLRMAPRCRGGHEGVMPAHTQTTRRARCTHEGLPLRAYAGLYMTLTQLVVLECGYSLHLPAAPPA